MEFPLAAEIRHIMNTYTNTFLTIIHYYKVDGISMEYDIHNGAKAKAKENTIFYYFGMCNGM